MVAPALDRSGERRGRGRGGGRDLPDAIEAAVAASDWRTARALFLDYRASPRQRPARTAALATDLMDWVAVLEAEAAYIEETGCAGPGDLPPRLARRSVRARMRLNLAEEALVVARAMRERFAGDPTWAKAEAKALGRLGDNEGPLAIGLEAWRAGEPFGASLAAEAFIALGDMSECERLLDKAEGELDGAEPSSALAWARIHLWNAKSEPGQALELLRRQAKRMPEGAAEAALAKQAVLARDQAMLQQLLAKVECWASGGEDFVFRAAAPQVLYAHFHSFLDKKAIQPWVDRLARADLAPTPARWLCKFFSLAGEYQNLRDFASETLRCFPSSISLWLMDMQALMLTDEQNRLAATRALMRRTFPPDSYLASMSHAMPRLWSLEEIPQLIGFNLNSGNTPRRAKFLTSLGQAALTEDQVEAIRAAAPDGSASTRAQIEMMLAPLADRQLLERSLVDPVPYVAFEESRHRTNERIGQVSEEIVAAYKGEFLAGRGMPDCLAMIARLRERPTPVKIATRESYADSATLVAAIVARLERREPASVIRVGDGEGHFVPAHESALPFRDADRAAIQNIWWGAQRMRGGRLQAIESRFRRALENATILALMPPWRFIAEMTSPKYIHAHRGIINSIAYGLTMNLSANLITSMHFPNDLHKWNLWPEVFAATRSTSFISCHALAPFLRETFGIEVRRRIAIPAEHNFAAAFEPDGSTRDEETLLDRHEAVCAAIDPLPGEPWLVAAGFLGKIYCDIVRERGGIGIDIGSLADYWMGFATRRHRLEQLSDIARPNTLIEDHVLAVPRDRARIAGSPGAVRSTTDCRYNIAAKTGDAPANAAPSRRVLLRVLGHPRCASTFMAGLLSEQGLQVGHERMLRDGVCSWMHAVADLHIPYGDNASVGVAFEHTIAHIRDPAEAVPSIMLENGRARSFNFRRLHILRETGVDLCDYSGAVERAVASLVHWYEIILRLNPEQVFRVEEAETAVPAWLTTSDLLAQAARIAEVQAPWTPALAQESVAALAADLEEDDPDDADDVGGAHANSSERKFGRSKPTLTPDSYVRLPPDLRAKLSAFCEQFGYDRPW